MSCGTCGMSLRDEGEYHPFLYCALFKAGLTRERIMANVGGTVTDFGGKFDPDALVRNMRRGESS